MIRLKGARFLTAFLLWVLFPVFLGAAEFPTYQKYEGPIKPGIVITKENWDQYLPELQKLLPPSRVKWYGMGVREGLVTMPIVKTTYCPITKGQREATKKYAGTARVGADNQLYGWVAGYPFPEPKNALELIWNAYPTISRANASDDIGFSAWFGLFKGNKYEKHFIWSAFNRKYRGRADIPPLGDMPDFTERGICMREALLISEPNEVKGFIHLRIRYWDVNTEDETYGYIPAIRRVRRLTGADNTDPLLGSDYVADDGEIWRQKLDSRMKIMVLEHRDFLVPRSYVGMENEPAYDYKKNGIYYQIEWELRPLWVVEIMINDPNYAYSKRILYIDAVPLEQGGRFMPSCGEMHDQKGRLLKAAGFGAPSANKEGYQNMFDWMNLNYQTDHYTAIVSSNPAYMKDFDKTYPLDEDVFTVKGLLRRAR